VTVGPLFRVFAVRQLHHPAHDPHRNRFAAHRADAVMFKCFHRVPANTAFAVAVIMVLSFLGEEVDGAFKVLGIARFQCLNDAIVIQRRIEAVGVSSQFIGGMGIGVGREGAAV